MGLVRRVIEDEPREKPNELGRALLRVAREDPGVWVEIYESEKRHRVVYYEGCLLGRAKGRIPGVTDIRGWDARCVELEPVDGVPMWALRVKFEGPAKDGQQPLPVK